MLCRNRWAGLEQEGYGIVFAEAAACGVAQLCGRSGGSDEAVGHEETGLVVERPASVDDAVSALGRMLADGELRARLGATARVRATAELTYDGLARRLHAALGEAVAPGPGGPPELLATRGAV
jgi:phosphatidylinositol alpha-1,6-mannosyltransferase